MVPQCPHTVEELIKGKVLLSLLKTHQLTAKCPYQGFRRTVCLAELALSDGACSLKCDHASLLCLGQLSAKDMTFWHNAIGLVFFVDMMSKIIIYLPFIYLTLNIFSSYC